VLARARLEALSGLFPHWRIWLDQAGWHARRRQAAYLQACTGGTPVYSVHAATPAALAAQLCWQQAADQHPPRWLPIQRLPHPRHPRLTRRSSWWPGVAYGSLPESCAPALTAAAGRRHAGPVTAVISGLGWRPLPAAMATAAMGHRVGQLPPGCGNAADGAGCWTLPA
jgi:hypothetical protein